MPLVNIIKALNFKAYINGFNKTEGYNFDYYLALNSFIFSEHKYFRGFTLKEYARKRVTYKLSYSVSQKKSLPILQELIKNNIVEEYYSTDKKAIDKTLLRYRLSVQGRMYLIKLNEYINNRISKVIK